MPNEPYVEQIMVADGDGDNPDVEEVKYETVHDGGGGGGTNLDSLPDSTNDISDEDLIVSKENDGWVKKTALKIWNYVKTKLGISAQGSTGKYLDEQGNFTTPPNTTYGVVSKTADGLAPQLPNETATTKFLRQDGSWAVPPDNNTTTGTSYNAGSCPDNTTFATNGSVSRAYDALNTSITYKTIEITADGVKTRNQLGKEIANAMAQIIASAPSSHSFKIESAFLPMDVIPVSNSPYKGGSTVGTFYFYSMTPYLSNNVPALTGFSVGVSTTASSSNCIYYYYSIRNNQNPSVSDVGGTVPSHGTKISISYREYI